MSEQRLYEEPLVFGLDIGTRNVVGTVGYKKEKEFIVVGQYVMEHETRAMLDGQIHDIGRVGNTIRKVREKLEEQTGVKLTDVCIAAAGRVLKTVTTNIEQIFPEETVVTGEDIHTLDLMGIEKAQDILKAYNDTQYKFYCVGYSVVRYFLNDEPFSNLESHKADKISEDIIATFLPEDVVDGLYASVGLAGLSVANMTLEPIAAINVAIPETFRMLNIALVDIGAGTSDICITRDGSIIAYGMIPLAGDELTELIVQHYLVDFKTAEHIKLTSGIEDEITYKDIMLIEHTIPASDVWELTYPIVDRMTTEVADKIIELNGGESVSATFIVGGGGKIHGYTQMLAEKLELPTERVALRGEEVLQEVTFEQQEIKKDPLLVTPIGICLNYYDQKNSFIMVRFNGERVKMYNNSKLTIVDVALAAGFPNEDLFPKRGKELQFMVNGVTRIVRGQPGESAMIFMNDRPANINTPLEPNSDIIIEPSTQGEEASCILEQLEEYSDSTVTFIVNAKIVRCPKLLEVNGSLELPSYRIQENDAIETRGFYTVGQLAEFMDVEIDMDHVIMVNNRPATSDTLIYENFEIEWVVLSYGAAPVDANPIPERLLHPEKPEEKAQPAEEEKHMEEPEPAEEEKHVEEPEPAEEEKHIEEPQPAEEEKHIEEPQPAEEEKHVEEPEPAEEAQVKGTPAEATVPEKEPYMFREPEPAADEPEKEPYMVSEPESGPYSVREPKSEPQTAGEPESEPYIFGVSEAGAYGSSMTQSVPTKEEPVSKAKEQPDKGSGEQPQDTLLIFINGQPVTLTGKKKYIFVDIFNFYNFDLSAGAGRGIIAELNGENAKYTEELKYGDKIVLAWKEDER